MKQKQRKTNKRRFGFTLIELLVVLLILGVLTGLGVPRYMEAQKYAKARTFAINVREIITALEQYSAQRALASPSTPSYPSYPTNLADLSSMFTQAPINPYTGTNMLTSTASSAGITYTASNGVWTIEITQENVDGLNGKPANAKLYEVVPELFGGISSDGKFTSTPTTGGSG